MISLNNHELQFRTQFDEFKKLFLETKSAKQEVTEIAGVVANLNTLIPMLPAAQNHNKQFLLQAQTQELTTRMKVITLSTQVMQKLQELIASATIYDVPEELQQEFGDFLNEARGVRKVPEENGKPS